MKLKSFFQIWTTLQIKEKKQFLFLFLCLFILAILQAIGVVSILPFIYVLTNPEIINENPILNYLKTFLAINSSQNFLIVLALFSFLSLLVANLFGLLVMYINEVFYSSYGARLSHTLFDTYLRQKYSFFLKYDSTQLLKNTTEEIDRYVSGVIIPLLKIINKSILLTVIIFIMIYASFQITFWTLITFVPGYAFIYYFFRRSLVDAGKEVETAISLRHKLINLTLRAIKEVKLFNTENYWSKKYYIQSRKRGILYIRSKVLGQSPQYFFETFAFGGLLLILALFISTDTNVELIPQLTLFAFAAYKIAPAIAQIYSGYVKMTFHFDVFINIYNHLKFGHNMFDEKKTDNSKNLNEINFSFDSEIEIRNLSFNYNEKDEKIFDNLNLKISKNENIGIIGESGIGKTTLIDILLGLVDNYSGKILIDKKELNSEHLKSWQNKIGYVPQIAYLTNESLKKNIAFSVDEKDIDEARVKECIELAELQSIVQSNSLETEFGDGGARLSGGQKQRISIARALYTNPEILVFDEATNSLDNQTSDKIIKSIKKISKNKTIIFISHNSKNLDFCDKIYSINNKKLEILRN